MKEIKTEKYNALKKAGVPDDALIGSRRLNVHELKKSDKRNTTGGCSGCSRSSRNQNG